jgi:hypothetical protein
MAEQGIGRKLHAQCGKHTHFSSLFFSRPLFRPPISEEVQKERKRKGNEKKREADGGRLPHALVATTPYAYPARKEGGFF